MSPSHTVWRTICALQRLPYLPSAQLSTFVLLGNSFTHMNSIFFKVSTSCPFSHLGFVLIHIVSSLLLFQTPNKNLLWVQSPSWAGLLQSAVTLNVFNRRAFPCNFYLLDVCLHSVLEYFGPIPLFLAYLWIRLGPPCPLVLMVNPVPTQPILSVSILFSKWFIFI